MCVWICIIPCVDCSVNASAGPSAKLPTGLSMNLVCR